MNCMNCGAFLVDKDLDYCPKCGCNVLIQKKVDYLSRQYYNRGLEKASVKILPQVQKNKKNIYHFTNEGVCSWYDFAHEIMRIAGLSCEINPVESKDYPTKATRPFYSVMSKEKIKCDFNLDIPHWRDSLIEVLKEMKEFG